jgi:pimeloyl-ACP methyl ester carboxylesterase
MDIILIAGLWLDGSTAWTSVVQELEARGHRGVPITLPGQGDGSTTATLDDQLATVVDAIDAAQGKVVVVGHSAACTLAWLATDARPERVARVGLIGGFPGDDGDKYAAFFDIQDGVMPFPGWEPFEGADAADLDEETRQRIADAAIGVPEAVALGTVHLTDERRFDVPVLVICPEFSPAEAKAAVDGGDVPSLTKATLEYVDIDSGHWPMYTKPAELADILAAAAVLP